ncbi:S1 RNA-binding domain-containing protein [candidate division KSB1 bacterium]|nr:S1 RNA-binding domain-containing protein [candidate division KSB1 bacterium]
MIKWEEIKRNYAPGQQVDAIIEKVDYYGIFTKLEDGTPGYVKRSEALYTERVVDLTDHFSPQQKQKALIIDLNARHKNLDLSFKSVLPNPLSSFCKQHHVGDIVEGEVVQVTDKCALIEIEKDVTGLLPKEELWVKSLPLEDVLMIEDRVRCKILELHEKKRPILSNSAMFAEEWDHYDKESTFTLQDTISEAFRVLQWEMNKQTVFKYRLSKEIVSQFNKIALIDSRDTVIKPLAMMLEGFGFQTTVMTVPLDENARLFEQEYHLFILSAAILNRAPIRHMLEHKEGAKPVIIFGTREQLASKREIFQTAQPFHQLVLPHSTEAIIKVFNDIVRGDSTQPEKSEAQSRMQEIPAEKERDESMSQKSLEDILKSIRDISNASSVVIFSMNINSREVDIFSFYGVKPNWDDSLRTHFQFSPVKDVIVDIEYLADDFGALKSPQFKKLGNFTSFVGQRILFKDEFGYALFLFGQDEYQFHDFNQSTLHFFEFALRSYIQRLKFFQLRQEEQKFIISGKLSAGLMHEIKNQLSALKCYLDVLKTDSISLNRGDIKVTDKAFLARFQESVNGALQIEDQTRNIEELFLNLFRKKDLQRINLASYLKSTLAALKPYAEHQDIMVKTELKKVPAIQIDKAALNQIIINLFMNSVEFIPSVRKTTGQIKIVLEAQSHPKVVRIHFWDNGPGINERLKERIFDLLFTTKKAGSGLGLHIAKQCAEALGGSLYLSHTVRLSETQFTLELPL